MDFEEKYAQFLEQFKTGRIMVLSTSLHDKVTSRMMSIIRINDKFYFQTDKTFRKYEQLKTNPSVALCIENIQIEGTCREVGSPKDHVEFLNGYQVHFTNSFHRYSLLDNERLFSVEPTCIERWLYIDGIPYMEIFDVQNRKYRLEMYKGK